MDCRAYCPAASYHIKFLHDKLKENYKTTLYRDVLHVTIPVGEISKGDLFFFPYGAMVAWGLPQEACKIYLDEARKCEGQRNEEMETDEFTFVYGDTPKIIEDEIILPNDDILSRLAISHGLAQSVKLGTFESTIRKTFDHTKQIPEDLAKYGSISLSRREIRRKMGELFIERNSINLHVDVLDTPEFFWEYSELEPLYAMTANYLDLKTRGEVLNHRLDVVRELFEMLGNELNHQHSSRLEWTIICLIIIEVLLTFLRDVLGII